MTTNDTNIIRVSEFGLFREATCYFILFLFDYEICQSCYEFVFLRSEKSIYVVYYF